MEVVISNNGFVDALRPAQGIGDIADAGFKNIAIDCRLYCDSEELENVGKDVFRDARRIDVAKEPCRLQEASGELFERCRQAGLGISVLAAPSLESHTKRTDLNGRIEQIAKESIRLCEKTGCRDIIIKPLSAGIGKKELWDVNKRFYLELAEDARKYGGRILLQNQCRNIGGHLVRGLCAETEDAVWWIDRLNEAAGEELFGFCVDTGLCALCGVNMHDFIMALGDRVKAVIVRDCDGQHETSMLPFTAVGTGNTGMDWLSLIRGLRGISFDGKLIFDIGTTGGAFSIMLRPQLLVFAKKAADYFKWQIEMESIMKKYDSIVLFGAGNMCRNYMKCYGKQYPPLFTCDNNSEIWGRQFCGLEIKSPEALRELPENCAIFICNMYYREIEKQLRGLNITNPIEYFNDEYMPDFYFERLEELEKHE